MHLWESTEVDGSVKIVRGGGPLARDIISFVQGVLPLTGPGLNNFSFWQSYFFYFIFIFYRRRQSVTL